jgi:hypothetical protein
MGSSEATVIKQKFYAPLLLLLTMVARGQTGGASSADFKTASCVGSPLLAELSQGAGAEILKPYGYDFHEPWSCTKIDSPWVAGSSLLRFQRVTAQSDDATAFSVVKVSGSSYIWVIPTETGMLEVPHAESDPHNFAAFNALLGTLVKGPSSLAEWNAVGKLYMVLLGHKEAVPMKPKLGSSGPCDSDGECALAFADGLHGPNEPYTKWTLTLSAPNRSRPFRLVDASKEVIRNPTR